MDPATWHMILFVIALCLFVAGAFRFAERQWVTGIILWICAALVGPGGISLFT